MFLELWHIHRKMKWHGRSTFTTIVKYKKGKKKIKIDVLINDSPVSFLRVFLFLLLFFSLQRNQLRINMRSEERGLQLAIRVHVLRYYDNKQWVTVDQPSITRIHVTTRRCRHVRKQVEKKKKKDYATEWKTRRFVQ